MAIDTLSAAGSQTPEPISVAPPGPSRVGFVILVLALLSTLTTFLVLAGLTPLSPTHTVVVTTLCINVGFGVLLLGIIVWQARVLVLARHRKRAGAGLHKQVILLFGIIAVTPALLLAAVAVITLDRGLDQWFSTRARTIVDNALVVSRAYLEEQFRTIRAETLAMASDINRARPLFDNERDRFRDLVTVQSTIRGMQATYIIKRDLTVVERAANDGGRPVQMPPPNAFTQATDKEPAILSPNSANLIGAVFKLQGYDDLWVFVVRAVDPRATHYLRMTEAAAAEYIALDRRRFGVQVAFGLMYLVIGLTLLLAAIWIGLAFANRLVSPISRLIGAADQVAAGNLYVQVPHGKGEGDLGGLSETFNRMTAQLRTQRNALLEASEQIDERRRFTEAVLSGVTAGVIGLTGDGRITLVNRSASQLFGASEEEMLHRPLADLAPEFVELMDEATTGRNRVQGTVTFTRAGRERTVNVRVTREQSVAPEHGYVVTLDDITDLVTAQRTSAWADVARRIAHEIKNPLTPIQLSAERIRRKYGKNITEDREVFDQCTDTIVRQVEDIKRMVDEFSSFARMPKPVIEPANVSESVRRAVMMMRVGYPEITMDLTAPDDPLIARFDDRLMSQAVTNIVKNAAESIAAVSESERGEGRILVEVRSDQTRISIAVTDNGLGLPTENRSRLLEPYMTTREKGTGLGLAIVTKILEEHGGGIELADAPAVSLGGRGARVTLWLPQNAATEEQQETKTEVGA
ncbi:PAS domain-containing sensor histidine kinase [Terrihabitans soli]|uniref:histidine kinase n=1 Tax=Terrihabitans soli TaxID=708113 RepID=A0A6S6QPT6_9HYPH|nr:PAS domain-containing sensor histidine kinase [Terrihabitans soli]BCJ91019.1 PAS domain-containing sensor histidine kinase [Terrihabitans soli]